MAKQHFYSRVPAKMSLYNKMDGYDTFACSDGIEREFVEKELAAVYDNKPVKEDSEAVRTGALPTVYSQFISLDGSLVQSAVSFIASDYTGERSSYLAHSLVLSEEEKKAHLYGYSSATLNPSSFKTNISDFDLVSFDAVPYRNYPEVKVSAAEAKPFEELLGNYDTGMIKRLIYSVIAVCCGKAKALYLALHSDISTLSSDSLEFLNSFLTIFPYYMREMLSFVTYIGDFTKYSSFKIKCIPESRAEVPTSKGITLKLAAKDYAGLSDDNIAANAKIVDFFYSLIKNDKMRREFIDFCDYALEKNPAFAKISLKNLGDLILLFKALSGFFEEKSVLPDDNAVYDFVNIYDKNRNYLKDSYRFCAFNCLKRYPENHTAVPKNVFSKVVRVYPAEPAESKTVIMGTVLDLIHTDAMREKLFSFIKANYENETDQSKRVIMQNVCRVYYGGFLQPQILEFFDTYFENEPEDTRSNIIERLLLTVRTPSIQSGVVEFVKKYYSVLSETEKDKFYKTFYDMLPEADELTRILADVVDGNIEDERKAAVEKAIADAVVADEKRSQPQLCAVLCSKCGFTEGVIAKKVFGEWSKRKVVDTFVFAVSQKDFTGKIDTVDEIFRSCPEINPDVAQKLLSALVESIKPDLKLSVFTAVGAVDKLTELKLQVPASAEFVTALESEALFSAVAASIPTCFDYKRFPSGVAELSELAKTREYLSSAPEFEDVKRYNDALKFAGEGNGTALIETTAAIKGNIARLGSAELLKKQILSDGISEENVILYNLSLGNLKSGELNISDSANALRDVLMSKARTSGETSDAQLLAKAVDEQTLTVLLQTAVKIYQADISDELKANLSNPNGELSKYLNVFVGKYDKKGKKFLSEKINEISAPAELAEVMKKSLEVKSSSDGFFKKLFRK